MRSRPQNKYDEACQGWKAQMKWSADRVMEREEKINCEDVQSNCKRKKRKQANNQSCFPACVGICGYGEVMF